MLRPTSLSSRSAGKAERAKPRPRERQRWALVTLSGQSFASPGNTIWGGIAEVMAQVNANIQEAVGTSMPSPVGVDGAVGGAFGSSTPNFVVSAFDTHITPFSLNLPSDGERDGADSVAVAIFLKALMAESSVPVMTQLFHTRFPRLACTVTIGGVTENEMGAQLLGQQSEQSQRLSGTLRAFGMDQVGQLATIAEVLHRCRVTIVNLLVTTGYVDSETCEFIERVGGPISENVIAIAVFDRSAFDEEKLRYEVEMAGRTVGYQVSSIILDNQENRAQSLASYYLRRKGFMADQAEASEIPLEKAAK